MPNNNYNGWIVSNSFLKRCFAIYGHGLVAGLIVAIPFFLIFGLISSVILTSLNLARNKTADLQMQEMQSQQRLLDAENTNQGK